MRFRKTVAGPLLLRQFAFLEALAAASKITLFGGDSWNSPNEFSLAFELSMSEHRETRDCFPRFEENELLFRPSNHENQGLGRGEGVPDFLPV